MEHQSRKNSLISALWYKCLKIMAKVNVYIDGFNLYYGAVKSSPFKWLDLAALCHRMLPADHIQSIKYFTAILSVTPTSRHVSKSTCERCVQFQISQLFMVIS
jgi:hypothetical protein